MLLFTNNQRDVVLNTRRAYNAAQRHLGEVAGDAIVGNAAIGNALPLPRDVWGEWDREGIAVQRKTMAVFNDLAASVSTPMPIGKLMHHYQKISDSGQSYISLDGVFEGKTDQQTFEYVGTPIPIISSPFSYGWRQVAAAQSEGFNLDGSGRENAMDKNAQKAELIALDGDTSIVVDGNPLYGLRTHPDRVTRATGVALNGATGPQWVAEFDATLKLLEDQEFTGEATIYVNFADWRYAERNEYTAGYPRKIAEHIRALGGVGQIVPARDVTPGQIIAINKDRRTVQVLNAMPMTTLPKFRANVHDPYDFVNWMAAAVQVKSDANGNCGVAVSSI